ncbi:MAG: hypothetical protein IJ862_03415 [Selenomonadaceae bacterium]|nr:hypothetical protein [Selenomonadaceae bacterium]
MIVLISIGQENGRFIFTDCNDKEHVLLDAVDIFNNRSKISVKRPIQLGNDILLLKDIIFSYLHILNDGTLVSFVRSLALLSILDKLFQKPLNFQFLQIGGWSSFSGCVANVFDLFGNKNHLYCLTNDKISLDISNVSFISDELGTDLLPNSKFSMVFIDVPDAISLSSVSAEVFLSLKDGGSLMFMADLHSIPKFLIDKSQISLINDRVAFVSLPIHSELKDVIFKQTDLGKLKLQKQQVVESIKNLSKIINKLEFLSNDKRNFLLDDTISSIVESEKIIVNIYEELNSSYIKPYFNELKEALIDYRLQDNDNMRKIFFEKILDNFRKVLYEMTYKDDFVLNI